MNSTTKLDHAEQKLVFAVEKVLGIYFDNNAILAGSTYLEAAETIKTLCEARIALLSPLAIAEKHND